ncbi:MAG: TetR/AcrR family transcriptional regulator [Deltaproteobacteria bacterium]|nr:TetR/AcrR family transcriptional regulator [Deltaproteobacteria bacterium]
MDARTKILETAARLFATHGYDSTSLSVVARDASVSKALIFWHFENKESLYEAVLSRTIEPYHIDMDELAGLGAADRISRMVDFYYDFINENAHSVRFFLSLFLREDKRPDDFFARVLELYRHYRELLAITLRAGQNEGTLSADVDPDLHAALILSTLNGVLVQGFTGERDVASPERLIRELKSSLVDRLRIQ